MFRGKNQLKNKIQGDQNFFMSQQEADSNLYIQEPARRLNDYDMNILQEDAYKRFPAFS